MARVSGTEAATESASPPALSGLQMATSAILHANRRAAHFPLTRRDRRPTVRLELRVLNTLQILYCTVYLT